MAITLMYITNSPEVAMIAQEAGVDRIWIDLEVKGKEERQKGMNTVKSYHSMEDIAKIKSVLNTSELMVRVNPIDDESQNEIDQVVLQGAQYIMLPMYRTRDDVRRFLEYVDGRAKTILLLETIEAVENIETYIDMEGIDEVHIGLNDLHIAYKKKFMFELMIDGTVKKLSDIFNERKIRFGVGGLARIGHGVLPAEIILTQHYGMGSQMAILSRSFCDANRVERPQEIKTQFIQGVRKIREFEEEIKHYTALDYEKNYNKLKKRIEEIVKSIKRSV